VPRLAIPAADEILDRYFPVLDHGFVALTDYMGGDLAVERFARGSYEIAPQARSIADTRRLLRYLMRHRHTSPFESTELSFHIGMPIFVARQWMRHRTSNANEISGRYVELPDVVYTPCSSEVCFQSSDNKQGSGGPVSPAQYEDFVELHDFLARQAFSSYKENLADGIAREMARIDLPLSTYTYFNWKMDLHNLFHFLSLRCKPDAQAQTRSFADVIAGIVHKVAPICFEAFLDYRFDAVSFTRMEMAVLRDFLDGYDEEDLRHALIAEGVDNKREQGEFFAKLRGFPEKTFGLDMNAALEGRQIMELIHGAGS